MSRDFLFDGAILTFSSAHLIMMLMRYLSDEKTHKFPAGIMLFSVCCSISLHRLRYLTPSCSLGLIWVSSSSRLLHIFIPVIQHTKPSLGIRNTQIRQQTSYAHLFGILSRYSPIPQTPPCSAHHTSHLIVHPSSLSPVIQRFSYHWVLRRSSSKKAWNWQIRCERRRLKLQLTYRLVPSFRIPRVPD